MGREEPQAVPAPSKWTPHRKPLAVAVGGLAVVTGVLVSTVLSSTGTGGTDGAGDTAPRGVAQGHPASADRPGEEPKPEKCENGDNPAASLRPSKDSEDAGDAVKRIKEKGKLTVGVDQNSYLWGYRDPTTGDIDGFDIELVRAIARDLVGGDGPDKITYKTIPTDQRIPAIQKGDVDMVVRTMTIACDRIDKVAFSTAYFEAGQQLLVPKEKDEKDKSDSPGAGASGDDEDRVKGFDESMRGKKICYASGSTAEKMMKSKNYKALGARPVVVPNQLDCLVRLQLGEADATVTDSALGAGQAAQDPSVELIGEPETVEPYGVAMNLKDEDLVRRVNKVLESFRKTKWRPAYDKWLGDDRMGTEDEEKPAPPKARYRD
ncbi:glutamate ABC transporter substrate-binding protein [Streptomyces iconiensis]|uniref:Glutamate ABC transporter substrate-binding protein n=1 Tax=Streptomyces iconiensis TaxID=1384038 RepID=A0ABT7A5J4_9ACTN|nr:glutamate ABC transporter substrate-binding protein [Streptomyces iconiensis]MDJ1136607.1 glutamate ABC transporter substrate-binding protein [Streptomyces iconiensis]